MKRNAFLRHVQPMMDVLVIREQLFDFSIGFVNVFWIARQRRPTEWPFAITEQWADVCRDKTREIEGIVHTVVKSDLANVIAVIDRWNAHGMKIQHGLNMLCTRQGGVCGQFRMLFWIMLRRFPLLNRPADRQIAID